MSAMNRQIVCSDMFVNDVLVGRSSANLDTFDSTAILDLENTNTLDMNYELKAMEKGNQNHLTITLRQLPHLDLVIVIQKLSSKRKI